MKPPFGSGLQNQAGLYGGSPGKDRGSTSLLEQEPGRPNLVCRAAQPTIKQRCSQVKLRETGTGLPPPSSRQDLIVKKWVGYTNVRHAHPRGGRAFYLLR